MSNLSETDRSPAGDCWLELDGRRIPLAQSADAWILPDEDVPVGGEGVIVVRVGSQEFRRSVRVERAARAGERCGVSAAEGVLARSA